MKEVTLDCETTTFAKGNPFARRNKLCSVGLLHDGEYSDYDIEYSDSPYGFNLLRIEEIIQEADLLIGFNIKFDIHWIRRYVGSGVVFHRIWDCQLAEFILSGQTIAYPSLADCLLRAGLSPKLDTVRVEFWDRGLDTTEVPWDTLAAYQKQDVVQTYELYKLQKSAFEAGDPRLYKLFQIQCDDLLCLEDAEFVGMRLDVDLAKRKEDECFEQLERIKSELLEICGDSRLNFSSPDHVSVFLYGGTIPFKTRVATQRVLKNGTIKHGEKWGTTEVEFPRLVSPQKHSESDITRGMSEGALRAENERLRLAGRRPLQRLYKVDEPTLLSISGASKKVERFIELLLEYSKIEKLHGTYYKGLASKIVEKDWPPGELHGNFNTCVVPTGRLSSSDPNLQNLAGETKALYISRY